MAKKPEKVPDYEAVQRTVWIPGWAYNYLIDCAQKERRDVKSQLSVMLEQAIRERMKAEGLEPGNSLPMLLAA